jgi:hypothetical protein
MPSSLPRVLAGPIVRRVEASSCSFWVALSQPAQVSAAIWAGVRQAGASPGTVEDGAVPLRRSTPVALRQFGDNLFVGLATVTAEAGEELVAPGLAPADGDGAPRDR